MDPNNNSTGLSQEDQNLQRDEKLRQVKDTVYKFFYAIWPSVNRVLSFFFYHLLRVIKGFFKVALEQFRQG